MTNFLGVSVIKENLQEIQEHARWLKRLLSMSIDERHSLEQSRAQQGDMTTHADLVREALHTISLQADELVGLLEQFESDPFIYTGRGSTAEVLAMLESLMALRKQE